VSDESVPFGTDPFSTPRQSGGAPRQALREERAASTVCDAAVVLGSGCRRRRTRIGAAQMEIPLRRNSAVFKHPRF